MIVNLNQITILSDRNAVAEASSLGFAPGEWPTIFDLVVTREDGSVAGQWPMVLVAGNSDAVEYVNPQHNSWLRVFND